MDKKAENRAANPLDELVSDFISYKRRQGYKYLIEENVLHRFSLMSAAYEIKDNEIPTLLFSKWFERRPNEKARTFKSRCSCVIRFLKYAKDYGYRLELPEPPKTRRENYVPYIFTSEEITQFFRASDALPPHGGSHRHEIAPVLFRLLYSCGLRSSEVVNLKNSDVDLIEGVLTIREPKNQRDRYVPMSASLMQIMKDFNSLSHEPTAKAEDSFFRSKYQPHLNRYQIYKWFRICLEKAGISHHGRGMGPREHDLRHSFCVHSLKAISEKGMDIYCFLPVLSTYVGHASTTATQSYLRLTAEL